MERNGKRGAPIGHFFYILQPREVSKSYGKKGVLFIVPPPRNEQKKCEYVTVEIPCFFYSTWVKIKYVAV